MELILVRHGQAESNVDIANGIVGSDRPLTREGVKQVRATAKWLAASGRVVVKRLVTSPYLRTRQTSEIIAEVMPGIETIDVDDRLAETNRGDWKGLPVPVVKNIEAQIDPGVKHMFRPPNGENWHDVGSRVGAFVESLQTRPEQQHLVVSHCHPIKRGIGYLTGTPVETWEDLCIANASVTIINHRDGEWVVADELVNVQPYADLYPVTGGRVL